MTKQSKITVVPTAISYGGTINQPTNKNIVPQKEYVVGTAVILDFLFI